MPWAKEVFAIIINIQCEVSPNFWLIVSGTTRYNSYKTTESSRGMKAHSIDIFSVGTTVSKMPMTCQINMLRERQRSICCGGISPWSPRSRCVLICAGHAEQASAPKRPRLSPYARATPTNRRTRAQIRGSPRNYWMIVSPREAPERSSMKPRPSCPWQRRMIMSLVVRGRGARGLLGQPGQSNMI